MAVKKRDIYIDALRGVAILLVVFAHALQSSTGMQPVNALQRIILTFEMPLLMMISGYTVCFSFPLSNLRTYFKKKIFRILLPYVVWVTLFYGLTEVMAGKFSLCGYIQNLAESQFWFLRILFIIQFVVGFVYGAYKRISGTCLSRGKLLIVFILCGVLTAGISRMPGFSSVISYTVCFALGMLCFVLRRRLNRKIFSVLFLWGGLLFPLEVIFYFSSFGMLYTLVDKSMAITGSMMVGILTYLFSKCTQGTKYLAFIGQASLAIYAIHWCLFFAPNPVDLQTIRLSLGWNIYPFAVIVFVIWTLLCLGLIDILRLNKYTKLLFLGE